MIDVILNLVEEAVVECIFERGWVEQTPDQFLAQSKHHLLPVFKLENIIIDSEMLDKLILDSLMRELGDEYDVNIYRLKFFPSETIQEYDV